jgi:hypothetical protein
MTITATFAFLLVVVALTALRWPRSGRQMRWADRA